MNAAGIAFVRAELARAAGPIGAALAIIQGASEVCERLALPADVFDLEQSCSGLLREVAAAVEDLKLIHVSGEGRAVPATGGEGGAALAESPGRDPGAIAVQVPA